VKRSFPFFWLLLVGGGLFLLVGKGPIPFPITAPFKTDKLSVAIFEDVLRREQLTKEQLTILDASAPGSVRDWVKSQSGEMRVLDNSEKPTRDLQWVQDAWQVAKDKNVQPPILAAANPTRGVVQPLPKDTVETLKVLKPLGK